MFGTTTVLSLLLTTATAFPISWPRIVARDYTPTQLAQGTNFFFDSLHLETQCSPGQIACVDSNLAKCSPEGNWEITPCTGNTTCLAVPSSDNGLLVQCMLYTDAQAAIGDENVSVDQGVQQAPMNTATAVASPSATETATPTESASESASESAPTDATPTDSEDPNATCTDGAEEPEATETQTITVILTPNPTESGAFITSTLTGDASEPTETTSIPEPSDGEIATETGSDGASLPAVTPTESSPAAEPTCTETPEDGSEPEETYTETDPTETESSPADEQPTDASSSDEQPTETSSTEEAAPTDAAPTDAAPSSSSSSEAATLTIAPGFNPAPSPPANASAPEVIVGGTHFVPAAAAPSATPAAKMMRVRRSS